MLKIDGIRSNKELDTEGLKVKASAILKCKSPEIRELKLLKKSIDARKRNEVLFVYSIAVSVKNEGTLLNKLKDKRVSLFEEKSYILPSMQDRDRAQCREHGKESSVIVGFGPAGMFAALFLSYAGLNPIVIERGEDADSRFERVKDFWENGRLLPESNVQFGEGGAGTFSDGKLQTGIKDREGRNGFVLKSFVKYGAPESILTDNKPHIGSDILRTVVKNIRRDIIEHGGQVRFNSRFTGYDSNKDGSLRGVFVNGDEFIPCDNLILAIGHSARDTFEALNNSRIKMEPKSFAVGLRVQHRQADINRALYGERYMNTLGAASYKLTYRAPGGRGVYSFCMCPGGYVVNSSSEERALCINGMSYSGRSGENANSAIVVTVTPDDFNLPGFKEQGLLSGMEFQRELERAAFNECDGKIPCQRLEDFKNSRLSHSFTGIAPQCKGSYGFGDLRRILPDYISSDIISAFVSFGKKIEGFDSGDAILSGVESRTSSPVRILRNDNFLSSVDGIYPAGEGAGYAGGIMSAAIDGLKCAEALAARCGR